MATWLIIIIYLAFISLGLPDSLLGSAWPLMRQDIGAPLSAAGILSMIIAAGTIVSSLASGWIIKRFGTGKVTLVSCCMTAAALLGFSLVHSIAWLALLAIPLGLGGGAVDAALNHYVAENYEAHHMNWLHAFWGIGATGGPIILSYYIACLNSWRPGYFTVSIIQFCISAVLLATLPLWDQVAKQHKLVRAAGQTSTDDAVDPPAIDNNASIFKNKAVIYTLIAFLFYCGVESTVGLWGASYLVGTHNIAPKTAAAWVSLYYGGITLGRIISGFITMKFDNRHIILWGQIIAIAGAVILLLPSDPIVYMLAFGLIGLGLSPIYPGLIHETPARFGSENSAKLIGYQMAVAYTGTTLLPPIFGFIAAKTAITIFPLFVLAYLLIMLASTETVNASLTV
ncbi:MFS transporter [Mahella australiensis]|uniref:Major facilitator superfamily MFS_1 n=1 Tax=Mahella australiensis (strain DSM 15567 / CIP 107919 / 50-1 BON) TaxID=697281 RepID=F3ZYM6_MAHA5|nr:MFS transporter [Mahella australiensis]AEE97794.1 major facilitator superfamily MFS_1 [Mahella australiensis 50-1 BON]